MVVACLGLQPYLGYCLCTPDTAVQGPTSLQELSVGWGQDLSSQKTPIRGADQGCCSILGPNPCRQEPDSALPLPPVAPSLPEPSHLFSAAGPLCSLPSAVHCTVSQVLSELSASSLFQAQPHQSNRWHCCHLQEAVRVLSQGLQLLCGLWCPCLVGWEDGRGEGGGRADLLLYSLPVRGLGVRNSFVQLSPSLCPSSCSPLSHCWGFVPAQGGEG